MFDFGLNFRSSPSNRKLVESNQLLHGMMVVVIRAELGT